MLERLLTQADVIDRGLLRAGVERLMAVGSHEGWADALKRMSENIDAGAFAAEVTPDA